MKQQFTYDDYSKTIRLMPQNYLVAEREKGHYITDPDAAIDDELATRIFLMLRSLKFNNDKHTVLTMLNTLLITTTGNIKKEMGNYLSDDEDSYDNIIEALRYALKTEPDTLIDFIEYTEQDGINTNTINVWEKLEFKFSVQEFCELVGIE